MRYAVCSLLALCGIAVSLAQRQHHVVSFAQRQHHAVQPSSVYGPSAARRVSLPQPVTCPRCWRPVLQTNWQWQLSGTVDQSVKVALYDVDLFDNGMSVVRSLHRRGRRVVCYMDAGSWEDWRPDARRFPSSVRGAPLKGWQGEWWLDIRRLTVLGPLMEARLDLCKARGFDGVEFDNVDGYSNRSGFYLTAADQLRYNVFLANMAHRRGLCAALKNDGEQVAWLLPYFDWALEEQCFQYDECGALRPFQRAGKAVMDVEYVLKPARFCQRANAMNVNALYKHLNLDSYRVACR